MRFLILVNLIMNQTIIKVYWLNEEYYGFGAGASGYVNGVRYTNLNPVNHYIKAINEGKTNTI